MPAAAAAGAGQHARATRSTKARDQPASAARPGCRSPRCSPVSTPPPPAAAWPRTGGCTRGGPRLQAGRQAAPASAPIEWCCAAAAAAAAAAAPWSRMARSTSESPNASISFSRPARDACSVVMSRTPSGPPSSSSEERPRPSPPAPAAPPAAAGSTCAAMAAGAALGEQRITKDRVDCPCALPGQLPAG